MANKRRKSGKNKKEKKEREDAEKNGEKVEKMLNKNEIIRKFVNNEEISETRTLKGSNLKAYYISGTNKRVLKNYNTIIALVDCEKDYNKVILNSDKYSQTTTRNQNLIKYYADEIEETNEQTIYKLINE